MVSVPKDNTDDFLFWGQLHIIMHSVVIIWYYRNDKQYDSFPFVGLLALFQIITYGLPIYFISIYKFQLNNLLNLESLKLSFFGYLIFYSTYFGLYNYLFNRVKSFRPMPENSKRSFFDIVRFIFLLIYLSSFIYQIDGIRHLINFSLYVYLGFTLSLILRSRINFIDIAIFISVLIFELINRVTSGLIASLAILILFLSLLVIIDGTKKYLLPFLLVPFFIFYIVFSGIKSTYRNITWFGGKEYTYSEKISLISDLVEESNDVKKDEEGNDNVLWRFSYPMAALSMVITKTPKDVPYWNGDSYIPLFTKFIPRMFYPSKPSEDMGQKFGKLYHVIRQSDNATSINTPILTELYINFGYNGFYIGMFLLGILFIFLNKFYNSSIVSYENKIVNMAIIFPLIIMESNFSLVYGNLILISVTMFALFRIFKFKQKI